MNNSNKNINEKLREFAFELGDALRNSQEVQRFLNAQSRVENDPESHQLDEDLNALYFELVQRQQKGEDIPRKDIDEFYKLRDKVFAHPMISERNEARQKMREFLQAVGEELNAELELDFIGMASTRHQH